MKSNKIIATFIFLILCISCTQIRNDDAILSFIVNSIKDDSLSYKSYLIIKSIDFPFFSHRVKKGFWVGPLYRKMTTEHSTIMIPKNHIQSLSNEKNIYIYNEWH